MDEYGSLPLRTRQDHGPDLGHMVGEVLGMAMSSGTPQSHGKFFSSMEQAVMTAETFMQGLSGYLPRPAAEVASAPRRLRDEQFVRIAEWCNLGGHPDWGLRPRTFVVLHMIGCDDAMDAFVADRLSDIALPYTEANLPRVIKGPARKMFLEYQDHVLTGQAANLERKGSEHQLIHGSANDYFVFRRFLGDGGFGDVDHVQSRLSLRSFARKRIPRGKLFSKDKRRIEMFQNELANLKKLSHHHLVTLIGSYTDRECVGLLMTPVADCNLSSFLKSDFALSLESKQVYIRRFFGCLATAVQYLHSQKIRHKDIKPENILVKDQTVLMTDFGTSHTWAEDGSSTTNSTVTNVTLRYCSPEALVFGAVSHDVARPGLDC